MPSDHLGRPLTTDKITKLKWSTLVILANGRSYCTANSSFDSIFIPIHGVHIYVRTAKFPQSVGLNQEQAPIAIGESDINTMLIHLSNIKI